MRKNQVDIISLGCSKNLVDSERLMYQLQQAGYTVRHDAARPMGEIAVVNTCGFIGDAKEESIRVILSFCQRKREGKLSRLFVMGCLSQRYVQDLQQELPEVDGFFGKFNYMQLLQVLGKAKVPDADWRRCLTTPSHYAYLKIAEGCNRTCSYCAIPLITGRYQSRPMEDIVDEARLLVTQGVKEFQVIAQDLTYYGLDLYGTYKIAELVRRLSDVPGVTWIRLHYGYPTHFPWDLLPVMRERDNVCKYMDIALQHISNHVLQQMRRGIDSRQTYELIDRLRAEVPGICLRTTLMVGHPGETVSDFEQLLVFVEKVRFERLGAFMYSEEDHTYAATHYQDDVPSEVKQSRLDTLMRLQQQISYEQNQTWVGRELPVIIDRKDGDYYIGRSQYDSPEVDMEYLIPVTSSPLRIGQFYSVRIVRAEEFDFYAEILK